MDQTNKKKSIEQKSFNRPDTKNCFVFDFDIFMTAKQFRLKYFSNNNNNYN